MRLESSPFSLPKIRENNCMDYAERTHVETHSWIYKNKLGTIIVKTAEHWMSQPDRIALSAA